MEQTDLKHAIDIQDCFGDYTLSCPYCKAPLIFPLCPRWTGRVIKCSKCDRCVLVNDD